MPIPLPNLDDRRWADLVDEGLSLVPVYSDEWTDFNPSGAGVTLMELFAWIAEMDIYQLNRVPDRHKRKFLELIGVRPEAARPARVALAFRLTSTDPVRIPKDTEFMVANLPFRTVAEFIAAPGALRAIQTTDGVMFHDVTASFSREPLWPFGIPPQVGAAIYFGFDQQLPPDLVASLVFHFAGGPPSHNTGPHHSASVDWEYMNSFGWWSPLRIADSTRSFSADGHIQITGPQQMRPSVIGHVAMPLFYIRARYTSGQYDSPPKLLAAAWNAVEAEQSRSATQEWIVAPGMVASGRAPSPGQAVSVLFAFNGSDQINSLAFGSSAEPKFVVVKYRAAAPGKSGAIALELILVAAGTGGPCQRARLTHGTPVVESSVRLYSLEDGAWRTWEPRLTFDSSSPADSHYVLDAQTGDILFGDGRHGRMLPEAGRLFASYRESAAASGTVAGGLAARAGLTGVGRVVTALPAQAGEDAESLGRAITRAVDQHEAPLRAITLSDYEALARATPGVDIARVSARANVFPALDSFEALGVVTVIIVPNMPIPMPRPSDGLLAAVRRHLNGRRVIGTRVEVIGPVYLQVAVNATIQSGKGRNRASLKRNILDQLNYFLDPLTGGPERTGWPFGRDVYAPEILQILANTPGVDHVKSLALIPTGGEAQCGNISLKPTWLVTPGDHQIQVT